MSGVMAWLRAADEAWRRPRRQAVAHKESGAELTLLPDEADESTTDTGVNADGSPLAEDIGVGPCEFAPQERRPKHPLWFKVFHLFVVALFATWVFLLPFWSWLMNDVLGEASRLCTTPASEIVCGDGSNYTETAMRLGRIGSHGQLVGCSCGESALGDWTCPSPDGRFSVSFFISTSPGTGMMAALTSFPILAQYLYGVGNAQRFCAQCAKPTSPDSIAYAVVLKAQVLFHIFFGLFLVNTLCVRPIVHTIVVIVFLAAMFVNFLTIAILLGVGTKHGRFILTVGLCGLFCTLGGLAVPPGASWFSQHAFYLGECIGLTCVFSIAPILAFIMY